jgi:uncharacterized protein YhbP (UPF0306 family)
MTIASADATGKPWASPVVFGYDENCNLYWVSAKDARHSRNIAARPQVGIVIVGPLFDGSIDGIYFDAEAHELKSKADIGKAIFVLAQRKQEPKFTVKVIEDVAGEAAWRIYEAVPSEITKRSDTGKLVNGQYVATREHVQL